MRHKKIFLSIILFTVLYVYMTNIDKIPERIVLFQNEDYEINHLKGIDIEGNSVSIADKIISKLVKIDSDNAGNSNLKLSAFGGFVKKDIEVSVLPTTKVVLGGHTVGIRLYSKGVLVVGKSPVQGIDGNWYEPYQNTSIEKGAKILKINDKSIETILELVEVVSNVKDETTLIVQYEKDGKICEEEMNPVVSLDDGRKKLRIMGKRWCNGSRNFNFL